MKFYFAGNIGCDRGPHLILIARHIVRTKFFNCPLQHRNDERVRFNRDDSGIAKMLGGMKNILPDVRTDVDEKRDPLKNIGKGTQFHSFPYLGIAEFRKQFRNLRIAIRERHRR